MRAVPPTGRRRPALLAAALLVALTAVAGCSSATPGPSVVVGTCRGFASGGTAIGDRALLERALATWRRIGGSMGLSEPVAAPVGPVCAVEAHWSDDGRGMVTLADATSTATYADAGAGGTLTATSDLPEPPADEVLPVLPVGDGMWRLAAAVTEAELWVGAPGVPPTRVVLQGDQVDLDPAVGTFAEQHPQTLPHVLVLLHAGGRLYAATGGPPYSANHDEAFAVSLGRDDPTTTTSWQSVLRDTAGVPLVAQAVGFAPRGRQVPGVVDRELAIVSLGNAPVSGTFLVLSQRVRDRGALGAPVVTLVQQSRTGADAQPVGVVLSRTGAWVGSAWLDPVQNGDPDPRELVVMGEPGSLSGSELAITVRAQDGSTAIVYGPAALLTIRDDEVQHSVADRPTITVSAQVQELPVPPLGPLP
ncbi:hypothetical protein [Lapillicoccus jejuensis]|uniref:Lipoprotein LpqB-like beta-propeller protein n=1 Tax=Lapillicoccus jejuensis TaxID=402171 RepID=A0A542DZ86_9MICO|nr:hypothetical protein [Lapillicoccus jejuensis]TQJ08410.1 hypothetical protein FB458_1498 [Lapillicoccus jejuensis]